jgi:hypothetical protein
MDFENKLQRVSTLATAINSPHPYFNTIHSILDCHTKQRGKHFCIFPHWQGYYEYEKTLHANSIHTCKYISILQDWDMDKQTFPEINNV